MPSSTRLAGVLPVGLFVLGNCVFSGLSISVSSSLSLGVRGTNASLSSLDVFPSALQMGTSDAPALNLEEDETCILTNPVPANKKGTPKTVEILPYQWEEYMNGSPNRSTSTLRAYQTTNTPGREREFMLSFKMPSDLSDTGDAILSMVKEWDGVSHNWRCSDHQLVITGLEDGNYVNGSYKTTSNVSTSKITTTLSKNDFNINSHIFGKGMKGKDVHLLFREKNMSCLSAFKLPKTDGGPVLRVPTDGTVDAAYTEWRPYSTCRVSCKTNANFQCRKRDCTPGTNDGKACVASEMLEKQACPKRDNEKPCTCDNLATEKACPAKATCEENSAGATCKCSGPFLKADLGHATICEAAPEKPEDLDVTLEPTDPNKAEPLQVLWITGVFECCWCVSGLKK